MPWSFLKFKSDFFNTIGRPRSFPSASAERITSDLAGAVCPPSRMASCSIRAVRPGSPVTLFERSEFSGRPGWRSGAREAAGRGSGERFFGSFLVATRKRKELARRGETRHAGDHFQGIAPRKKPWKVLQQQRISANPARPACRTNRSSCRAGNARRAARRWHRACGWRPCG